MKAILEFDDEKDLRDAIDGWKWKSVVWELDQDLRGIVKHGYFDLIVSLCRFKYNIANIPL